MFSRMVHRRGLYVKQKEKTSVSLARSGREQVETRNRYARVWPGGAHRGVPCYLSTSKTARLTTMISDGNQLTIELRTPWHVHLVSEIASLLSLLSSTF